MLIYLFNIFHSRSTVSRCSRRQSGDGECEGGVDVHFSARSRGDLPPRPWEPLGGSAVNTEQCMLGIGCQMKRLERGTERSQDQRGSVLPLRCRQRHFIYSTFHSAAVCRSLFG
uniref:Uncharacterized protein n=1 Tax=Knipowitschia caucasica TaxID=637954 RepID=A0AAV2KD50_KNICA